MGTKEAFSRTDHRPWPVPRGPWAVRMTWADLLFAHWRVPAERLRPLVPGGLEIEEFDGSAWLGIVPLVMRGVRLRGLPPLPTARDFEELNVRTYVRRGDRPGVWFLSLDAASGLFAAGGRVFFRLPYHRARMSCALEDGWVSYRSRREQPGAPPAELVARYRPTGPPSEPRPGTLDHFLAERYRLYAAHRGRVLHADVQHPPWPLQPAEGRIELCTMQDPHGLALAGEPLLSFARRQEVVGWRLRRSA